MTLSIFDRYMGSDKAARWPVNAEEQGDLAVDVLDSVQTIVDVLVERGQDFRVGFAAEATAYTDFNAKRIAITAAPLKEGGRPLDEIVNILTGFAVHEVGHARSDESLTREVGRLWPGKVSPGRLANTMQDVRLERAIIETFPGLAGVFDPTMQWVAEQDLRKHGAPPVYMYGTTLSDRLNFVAGIARYRAFIIVSTDPTTVAEETWWTAWLDQIVGGTTDEQMLALLRVGLAHLHENVDAPQPVTPPEGGEEPGPEGNPGRGKGEPKGEKGDDTEGEEPGGPAGDPDDDLTEGEGEGKGQGDEPGDDEGDTEGDDGDGDGDGDDESKGGDDGGSKRGGDADEQTVPTDMDKGESLDRTESDGTATDGAGGSGKAITEATDGPMQDVDVDKGLDSSKLLPTQDEINHTGQDWTVNERAKEQRSTTRLNEGSFGSLKVKVIL